METEKLKSLIRDCGLKCTNTRLAVLEYLVTSHRPVSTQDIIHNLKDTSINEVTIYRILESFVDKELIQPVEHWDRHRLYEAHLGENCHVNHAHFSCRVCSQVLCIEDNIIHVSNVSLPPGFELGEIRMQIEGICPSCNPDHAESPPLESHA